MIAFAFVAFGSGFCILKMNNFMQLLILLLFMDRGACTGTGVRNSFQADASGGGDQRRRKPWQEWKYIGPPNFAPNEWPEDPPSWLKFAKKYGFVNEWRRELRRPCFYKGSLHRKTIHRKFSAPPPNEGPSLTSDIIYFTLT